MSEPSSAAALHDGEAPWCRGDVAALYVGPGQYALGPGRGAEVAGGGQGLDRFFRTRLCLVRPFGGEARSAR